MQQSLAFQLALRERLRQVDSSQVECRAACYRASAGVRSPRASCGRSSLSAVGSLTYEGLIPTVFANQGGPNDCFIVRRRTTSAHSDVLPWTSSTTGGKKDPVEARQTVVNISRTLVVFPDSRHALRNLACQQLTSQQRLWRLSNVSCLDDRTEAGRYRW